MDHKKGQEVALKLIRNKKRFHHQALVEVKLLAHIRDADPDNATNIIHVRVRPPSGGGHAHPCTPHAPSHASLAAQESFYFRNHLCITFEIMSMNLYEFIKNNNFQGVSLGLVRRFAVQLLTCLKFLRKQSIVHWCGHAPSPCGTQPSL